MKKLKVITVLGTRPEIIRLSRVIAKLDIFCDHTLVHTGQNYDYGLNQIFFDDLKIRKPDYYLDCASDSANVANTIGNIIVRTDEIFSIVKPDAMLVLGDTNSCLSVIPAKRRKIPIFHMEAGNRCFDMRVPEEINRRIVDHTADVNLTYSTIAREYLLREGLPPDQIIKVGSPMFEVLNHNFPNIQASNILSVLDIREQNFFLVSAHREENIDSDKNFASLINILNGIAEKYNIPVVVTTHPRTKNRINKYGIKFQSNIRLIDPVGFSDYIKLQVTAKAVLSDSGTINEESSILNFPALNLREANERPEAMEEATVMMVGLDLNRVYQGLDIINNQSRGQTRNVGLVADYNISNVSEKVLRIITSYTNYINRVVWKLY